MKISQYFRRIGSFRRPMVDDKTPAVSVIITCYNHGRFLPDSIGSVLAQSWDSRSAIARRSTPVEIVVVDDGSTDQSRAVCEQYPSVRYIYQPNQGLSAARNTGVQHSVGDFLIFLDADDWLYTNSVATGYELIHKRRQVAFVSGSSDRVDTNKNKLAEINSWVKRAHFRQLLQGNYIGMHATVMYRRTILQQYPFDTSLRACEDYDMYLRIARNHPVVHHNHKVAAYRMHDTNMSADLPMMMQNALHVLERQMSGLRNTSEQSAYAQGRQNWIAYYADLMQQHSTTGRLSPSRGSV